MAKLKGKALASARRNIKKAQAALRAKARRSAKRVTKRVKSHVKHRIKRAIKRNNPKKTNKPKKKSNSMAKGKSRILSNPTLRKVLMASGAVTIATSIAALVFPQALPLLTNPLVRGGIGFVTGDLPGALVNLVTGGGIASIFGGGAGGGNGGAGNA